MYANQNGLSVYGAFVDRYTTHSFDYYTQTQTGASILAGDPKVMWHPTNEYSVMGEVGYIIDRKIEPFGRWEFLNLRGTPAGSRKFINNFAAGVNYFFAGHRVKLTGEVLYLPQGIPIDESSSNELANPNGETELVTN